MTLNLPSRPRAAFKSSVNPSSAVSETAFTAGHDRSSDVFGGRSGWRFGAGRHTLRVKAVDQAGNADQTPAVYRFTIKRVG